MISPEFAAAIIIGFLLVFGVVLPMLNVKFKEYVSYRWLCIVVVLALLIGAVVDFAGLPDDSRKIVLTGGLVITGVYVILRTLEKIAANPEWSLFGTKNVHIEASKGDLKGTIDLKDDTK